MKAIIIIIIIIIMGPPPRVNFENVFASNHDPNRNTISATGLWNPNKTPSSNEPCTIDP